MGDGEQCEVGCRVHYEVVISPMSVEGERWGRTLGHDNRTGQPYQRFRKSIELVPRVVVSHRRAEEGYKMGAR
jgi:hypothetical protein